MSFRYKETFTSVLFPQFNRISVFKCKPVGFNHYGDSECRTSPEGMPLALSGLHTTDSLSVTSTRAKFY